MAAEEVLQLFDSYWFEHVIFTSRPTISSSVLQLHDEPEKSKLSRTPTLIVRSFSDQLLISKDSLSPRNGNIYTWQQQQYLYSTEAVTAKNGKLMTRGSIATVSDSSKSVHVAKLQTILSGKEVGEFSEPAPTKEAGVKIGIKDGETDRRIRRKKKGNSKSLSELEFEELKGFIDLGFVFSDEDTEKSSLVSIVPGLQRLRRKACDDHDQAEMAIDESAMSRPYLSEAWECFDKKNRKVKGPLMNWRIPAFGNEMELKDHLKFWAQSVASTVSADA